MELNTKQNLSQNVMENANGLHWFNGDETIEITISDRKFMSKIRKLAALCPDVVIDQEPSKDNGGFMLALIPYKCLKLGKPRPTPNAEHFKKK